MLANLLIFFSFISFCYCGSDRVRLSDVTALTFYKGRYTNSRRSQPISQLQCIGGTSAYKKSYHPDVVQCYNRGFDGRDVQWECRGDLSPKVKFGRMDVNCEGYDNPDDPYILVNSCGLKYELNTKDHDSSSHWNYMPSSFNSNVFPAFGPFLIIGGLLACALLLWCFCLPGNQTTDDDFDHPSAPPYRDPPPPYGGRNDFFNIPPPAYGHDTHTRQRPPYPSSRSSPGSNSWWRKTTTTTTPPHTTYQEPSTSSWMPNLLSAGAGFLGGYWARSRDNTFGSSQTYSRPRFSESPTRVYRTGQSSSSSYRNEGGGGHSRGSSNEGASQATGFATTSRR